MCLIISVLFVLQNVGKALRYSWKCLMLGLQNFTVGYSTPLSAAASVVPDFHPGAAWGWDRLWPAFVLYLYLYGPFNAACPNANKKMDNTSALGSITCHAVNCSFVVNIFSLNLCFHLALYSYKKDMYLFLLSDISVYTVFSFDWKKHMNFCIMK